jgi:hypothetical protein
MSLTIMSAASATSVWALGPNDSVVHYDGNSWAQLPTPVGPLSLYGISAVSASTVWVSGKAGTGSNATVAFWDGAFWTLQTTAVGRTETVYALATVLGTSVAFAATYSDKKKKKTLPPVNRRWVEEGAERIRAEPWSWPLPLGCR